MEELVKWSPAWKDLRLASLRAVWENCGACDLCQTRQHVVFGEGNPDADIVFIGEGPGEEEDKSGRPFWGASGSALDVLFAQTGIPRESVYITNLIGCHPPDNRVPQKVEREACWGRLQEILYLVDPLVVVPVGADALKALGGRDCGIIENHGAVFSSPSPQFRIPGDPNGLEIQGRLFPRKGDDKKEYTLDYDMIPIVHPSYILRTDGWDKKHPAFPSDGWMVKTLRDLRKIKAYVASTKEHYSQAENAR